MEGAEPKIARADARVQVAVASKRRFGVVDMQCHEIVETDDVVELLHDFGIRLGRAQIVARCEDVASVQTDAYAIFFLHVRDDGCDVLESTADGVTQRSHCFEDSDDGPGLWIFVCTVQVFSNKLDALFASRRIGVSRVEVVQSDAEFVAANKVVLEAVIGLLLTLGVRVCKVDKVRAMWQTAVSYFNVVLLAAIDE